jgi:hypothetical protein
MQDNIKPPFAFPSPEHQDTAHATAAKAPAISLKPVIKTEISSPADSDTICFRNPVTDITFLDSLNIISSGQLYRTGKFPYSFIEQNTGRQEKARAALVSHLRPGQELPSKQFHNDWFLLIFLIAAFLYSVIRTTSKTMLPEVARFLFFRGINDPSSRDIGGLFNWQATLLNLISFLNIGLFFYYAAQWYDSIPSNIPGYLAWLIIVGALILVVTIRHLLCTITGNASDQQETFREYLLAIYQSHRLSGIVLFIIVILISYTRVFQVKLLIEAGFITLLLMYFIRAIRLLLIFINRNISIFYLILYLCSLEILPFLVLIKYSFGRF